MGELPGGKACGYSVDIRWTGCGLPRRAAGWHGWGDGYMAFNATLLAFFPVGPELFWQQPIDSSQYAQGALLPCAFRHIATKPAPDTST